jgi:hypothetical protein
MHIVKRLVLVLLACAAVFAAAPGKAEAGQCGIPGRYQPLWIDFADGSVPFWHLFARPGIVGAAANFIYPPRLRAAGAKTVYWEMNLKLRVGTPSVPADPAKVEDRADKVFYRAVASSACATPWIALNELWGSRLPNAWSPANAQYRANVLVFLRRLSALGARPFLLVAARPFTEGETGEWWRQVAQVADIVREVYFSAPRIHNQGVVRGSRSLREAFRSGVMDFMEIGIPPRRLGIFLGFQTTRGYGGREGLNADDWYEHVKLQALAARQVAREIPIATLWSWGWGAWSKAERQPEKAVAACVYLWTRNPRLCDGPGAAGPDFNTSRTAGQLQFPRGVQCKLPNHQIRAGDVSSLAVMTGDREMAFTSLFASIVLRSYADVTPKELRSAERAIVAFRFGGNRGAYLAALARAFASPRIGRGVIADELRRAKVLRWFRVAPPTGAEIAEYHRTFSEMPARYVEAVPAPSWLGRRRSGVALESVAPAQVFRLRPGRKVTIKTLEGKFKVRAKGFQLPLGVFPLAAAGSGIRAALISDARRRAFDTWFMQRQATALGWTNCRGDHLPAVGALELTTELPFLAQTG